MKEYRCIRVKFTDYKIDQVPIDKPIYTRWVAFISQGIVIVIGKLFYRVKALDKRQVLHGDAYAINKFGKKRMLCDIGVFLYCENIQVE
jgi:hypothetical protein